MTVRMFRRRTICVLKIPLCQSRTIETAMRMLDAISSAQQETVKVAIPTNQKSPTEDCSAEDLDDGNRGDQSKPCL